MKRVRFDENRNTKLNYPRDILIDPPVVTYMQTTSYTNKRPSIKKNIIVSSPAAFLNIHNNNNISDNVFKRAFDTRQKRDTINNNNKMMVSTTSVKALKSGKPKLLAVLHPMKKKQSPLDLTTKLNLLSLKTPAPLINLQKKSFAPNTTSFDFLKMYSKII